MSHDTHQRNNDRVLLTYYHERPELFAILVRETEDKAALAARLRNAGATEAEIQRALSTK